MSYISENGTLHLSPKRNLTLESFLYFRKREPRTLSQKKAVLMFRETKNQKKTFYISGKGTFLIFQERNTQNLAITELSYLSGKEYSERCHNETFLIFQEIKLSSLIHCS